MSKHVPPPTGEPVEAPYLPTDVSPEEAFQAIGRLRKEARDEIHRLIQFLDDSDNHMELDEAVDDVPCDDRELEPSLCGAGPGHPDDMEGDDTPSGRSAEDEPSLGSVDGPKDPRLGKRCMGGQERWAQGAGADQEGDAHEDDEEGHDREGDELQHGGEAEREDDERGGDDEPSLGWTASGAKGDNSGDDREIGGSVDSEDQTLWVGTGGGETGGVPARKRMEAIRKRYTKNAYGMHPAAPNDGKHVDSERAFANRKRLCNLSDRQKELVEPRIDRDAVSISGSINYRGLL